MTAEEFFEKHPDHATQSDCLALARQEGVEGQELNEVYRACRNAHRAALRGVTFDHAWKTRRGNIKRQKGSYTDASFATEELAT
jgi:hypothetical protein